MARSSDLKALRRSPKGPKHRPSAEPKELTRSGRDGDTGVALAPEPPTALWEFGALDSGTREIQLSNVRVCAAPKGTNGPLVPIYPNAVAVGLERFGETVSIRLSIIHY